MSKKVHKAKAQCLKNIAPQHSAGPSPRGSAELTDRFATPKKNQKHIFDILAVNQVSNWGFEPGSVPRCALLYFHIKFWWWIAIFTTVSLVMTHVRSLPNRKFLIYFNKSALASARASETKLLQ